MSAEVTNKADDNLLIVKSSDIGHIATLNRFIGHGQEGVDSLIEMIPHYNAAITKVTSPTLCGEYVRFLKAYQDSKFDGIIKFIKDGGFNTFVNYNVIAKVVFHKLNEIFRFIVVRRSIAIEDFELDFEDLYKLKDQIREVNDGLELFGRWLNTQYVLYTEDWKQANELCYLDQSLQNRYPDLNVVAFPILNCVSIGYPVEFSNSKRMDLIENILKNEKYTVTKDKEPKLYSELEGYFADKEKFFNILHEMYLIVNSPYDYLGGLFRFKVYRTLDGEYNIVNCRSY